MEHHPSNVEVETGRIMRRQIERALALACAVFGWALISVPGIFDSAFYSIIGHFASQQTYGGVLFGLGLARLIVLIVNGYWPVGPTVRLGLSAATSVVVWVPFIASSVWLAIEEFSGHSPGAIVPSVVLAPVVGWCEIMCALSLRAWIEAKKA